MGHNMRPEPRQSPRSVADEAVELARRGGDQNEAATTLVETAGGDQALLEAALRGLQKDNGAEAIAIVLRAMGMCQRS